MPSPLRYLSLFSGIGVAELALQRVFPDATCVGFSETDPDVLSIYGKHYPANRNLGDVAGIDGTSLRGQVDLIVGGSPCQGFSKIGKKAGFQDVRSNLFFQFARLVNEIQPRFFILENVKSMSAEVREVITQELGVQPVVLDAAAFTPQVRARLYWCNFPVTTPSKDRVPPSLSDILIRDHRMKDLTGNSFRGVAASTIVANRPPGSARVFAFTTCGHYDNGMIGRKDNRANTVTTVPNDLQVIFDGEIVRRLDCVEAERLQGLPDDYTAGLPRVRRWKCIGNSFTCDVMVHVLECLRKVMTYG